MKRSINSTGRKRITHGMVAFRILRSASGEPVSFDADLTGLATLGLPPDAKVSVEPFSGHSGRRFEFGTIGAPSAPADNSLSEIDRGGEINFRVKVIDDVGHMGRLLASGDRFSALPSDGINEGQMPLLPVKREWLGERIWDVSTADGSRPYLLINAKIPGLSARIQDDPLLRGAILVEAFRKVLSAMLNSDSGDELAWFRHWKTFLSDVLGLIYPEDLAPDEDDEREAFIDEALTAFSVRFQFATTALPTEGIEEFSHE